MYQRILVPLDGSHGAERALPLAVRLARCTGGTLMLVRAVSAAAADDPHLSSTLTAPASHASEQAQAYLERVAAQLKAAGVSVDYLVRAGSPVEVIVETARATARADAVDSIVMQSTGRTSRARWVLGSVARRVVERAPVPLLMSKDGGRPLPPAPRYEPRPRSRLRMLVPLDGSELAEAALTPALRLIEALAIPEQGNLHLVQVVPAFGAEAETATKAAEAYLHATAARLEMKRAERPGPAITWAVLHDTDVAVALAHLTERGEPPVDPATKSFDLVVLATHGQGGLERKLLGGVTEQVLNHTRVPVLVVRPHVPAEQPRRADDAVGVALPARNGLGDQQVMDRDPIAESSMESFPASDAPSWLPHYL